jgi:hypothetical protein
LSGFQRSGSEMLDFWILKKYNKLVKNYFQMKFECADLIYRLRGIRKCNKMGGITDSTKRYGYWKKSSTNRSGVFYLFCHFAHGTEATGGAMYSSLLLTKSQNK